MFRTSFTYYIPKAKAGPTFSFQHLNKATSKKHLQFVKKGFKVMTLEVMSVPVPLLHQEQCAALHSSEQPACLLLQQTKDRASLYTCV